MEVIRIDSCKNGKKNIIFDTGESCMLYAKEISQAGIREHAVLSEDAWQLICQDILLPRAKKRVLYLLERMERTEYQLRQKLSADGHPKSVIDAAIAYVKEYHYIDDLRYACAYIRAHENTKSKYQMQQALVQKGIRRDVIDEALEESYEGDTDALIRRLLDKKHYDPNSMDRKETGKIYQSLLRKGFRSEEIRRVMRSFDADEDPFDGGDIS